MNPTDGDRLRPLLDRDWSPEALAIRSLAAYLWCPGGVIDSALYAAVARIVGDACTVRNWATIMKLRALTVA